MLCSKCLGFFNWIQSPTNVGVSEVEEYQHHESDEALQEAIVKGCLLCIYVWKLHAAKFSNYLWDKSKTPKYSWSRQMNIFGTASTLIFGNNEIIHNHENGSQSPHTIDLDFLPVQPEADRLKIPGYEATPSTGSSACLSLARHWLRTCRTKHKNCERPQFRVDKFWKPTRLIFIGDPTAPLRIVENDDIPFAVNYITLSHCWGKIKNKVVLTSHNLKYWKKAIPSLEKFKTFSDAIAIVRGLDMSYAWIDSLCIMQDSEQDWQRESAHMCNIYKYSYCNISATYAVDDTVGCFYTRRPEVIHQLTPLRVKFIDNTESDLSTSADSGLVIPSLRDSALALKGMYDLSGIGYYSWEGDVASGAVNQRAWVLQERILSPRVLHYTSTQIYWECTELQASELFPYGLPEHRHSEKTGFKTLSPFNIPIQDYNRQSGQASRLHTLVVGAASIIWKEAVSQYSCSKLSYNSDKLFAISAIAREIQRLKQCKYLAGMWETDLIFQLSWYCPAPGFRSYNMNGAKAQLDQPDTYRAPSWSWASVNWGVRLDGFHFHQLLPLAEVVDHNIELNTSDEFGQVNGGYIRIRGQLIEIDYQYFPNQVNDLKPDHKVSVKGHEITMRILEDDNADEMVSMLEPPHLYALPLYADIGLRVLILAKVDKNECFRRVGMSAHYSLSGEYYPQEDVQAADFDNPFLSLIQKLKIHRPAIDKYLREINKTTHFEDHVVGPMTSIPTLVEMIKVQMQSTETHSHLEHEGFPLELIVDPLDLKEIVII